MRVMLFVRDSKYKTHYTIAFVGILVLGVGIFFFTQSPNPGSRAENVTVTIPDGLRKEQTAHILANALEWSKEQEQKFVVKDTARDIWHVEGTYPGGTYTFSTASSTYEIASALLDVASDRYQRLGNGLTPDEWYDILKVAAIAEREAETVADLNQRTREIWQAWLNGELLQSDATVQYVRDSMHMYASESCGNGNITSGMVSYDEYTTDSGETRTVCIHWRLSYTSASNNYEWWTSVTDGDRALEHGYNTYLHSGVPQHPIATPYEESIIAAKGTRSAYTGDRGADPRVLTDGVDILGLGTFHNSPTQNGLKSYQSELLDISLNYPESYRLFEGQGQGSYEYYVITISPEPYISEIIASDADTEWPASIQLVFYREPSLSVSLEEWIRTKRQSNFDVSDPAQKGILTPTTIADISALQYEVVGLYDFEYTAFLHGEWVVLATNPGVGEHINQDFQTVLSSLQLSATVVSGIPARKTYANATQIFTFQYPSTYHVIDDKETIPNIGRWVQVTLQDNDGSFMSVYGETTTQRCYRNLCDRPAEAQVTQ